jgi:hypothetical protein
MPKFSQGTYKPKNLNKYVGKTYPTYRSSWELQVFRTLDFNENIIRWGSELVKIPYVHPFTGKVCNYVPDLLIEYVNNKNQTRVELIEIKPMNQSIISEKTSQKLRETIEINHAKWKSAHDWAQKQGISFRIMTEKDIFFNKK